jgi:NADP-dependent 3-hydroxy acid dehydrogenase YdfG
VLAAEGAKVIVAARRKARLDDLVKEIGANALAVQCDVTDEAQVDGHVRCGRGEVRAG